MGADLRRPRRAARALRHRRGRLAAVLVRLQLLYLRGAIQPRRHARLVEIVRFVRGGAGPVPDRTKNVISRLVRARHRPSALDSPRRRPQSPGTSVPARAGNRVCKSEIRPAPELAAAAADPNRSGAVSASARSITPAFRLLAGRAAALLGGRPPASPTVSVGHAMSRRSRSRQTAARGSMSLLSLAGSRSGCQKRRTAATSWLASGVAARKWLGNNAPPRATLGCPDGGRRGAVCVPFGDVRRHRRRGALADGGGGRGGDRAHAAPA